MLIRLLTTVCVAMALGAAALAGQMLPNPSFEREYAKGIAPGWERVRFPGDNLVRFARETKLVYHGKAAQRIECTRWRAARTAVAASLAQPLKAETNYDAAVWVRADRPLATVELLVLDMSAPKPQIVASKVFAAGREWQRLRMAFHCPAALAHGALAISLSETGALIVDHASLGLWPGADKSAKPVEGNLVRNGSFELGMAGWQVSGPASSVGLGTRTRRGHKSLCVTCGDAPGVAITSAPLRALPGREHVLSLCLLADPPRKRVRIGVAYRNHDQPIMAFDKMVEAAQPWQRFEVRGGLPPSPSGEYFVRIIPGAGQGKLWVDTVQLEEGSRATAFRPRDAIVMQVEPKGPKRGEREAVSITATSYNSTLRIVELQSVLTVRDAWGNRVERKVMPWEAKPGFLSKEIKLNTKGKSGAFRVRLEGLSARDKFASGECWFKVLPKGIAPVRALLGPPGPRMCAAPIERAARWVRRFVAQPRSPTAQPIAQAATRADDACLRVAQAVATALVGNAKPVAPPRLAGIEAAAFRKPDGRVLALWADPAAHDLPLSLKLDVSGPAEAIDIMGNVLASRTKPGKLKLQVGREPIFVKIKGQ